MEAPRFDSLTKIAGISRRSALLSLAVGLVLPVRRASTSDTSLKAQRDGDPGPAPSKCSKLYGKCFVNSDCCARGARCDRTGRNRCLCKRGRALCKPQGTCCPKGQVCCGRCANLKTSSDHCGACGVACAVGEVCVGGICTA